MVNFRMSSGIVGRLWTSSVAIGRQHGFDIQVFGEKEEEKTTNLYARYGDCSPNICFAGHIDVVPPLNENLWDYNPFELKVIGEKVYGRGTVDMKGAIACGIVSALNYLKIQL